MAGKNNFNIHLGTCCFKTDLKNCEPVLLFAGKTTYDLSLMTVLIASLRSSLFIKFRSTVIAAPLAVICTRLSGWSVNKGIPTIGTPW